jgi:hypothetical protein
MANALGAGVGQRKYRPTHCPGHEPITCRRAVLLRSGINVYACPGRKGPEAPLGAEGASWGVKFGGPGLVLARSGFTGGQ